MRYHLFLHYGWFLQNLEKDFIPSIMHTTVGSFVLKGGSGIHFYTDLHFTTTSKEVKKGNYLIVHWNYKTVIFSMTSWLHFHNFFSKGNLGTFMIVCGTKL